MNWGYPAKRWKIWDQKWASENPGAIQTLSLSQGKVKVGYRLVGGSGVNYELLSRSPRLKRSDILWMDSVEPEYEVSDVKDGRVQIDPRHKPYHYLRES